MRRPVFESRLLYLLRLVSSAFARLWAGRIVFFPNRCKDKSCTLEIFLGSHFKVQNAAGAPHSTPATHPTSVRVSTLPKIRPARVCIYFHSVSFVPPVYHLSVHLRAAQHRIELMAKVSRTRAKSGRLNHGKDDVACRTPRLSGAPTPGCS